MKIASTGIVFIQLLDLILHAATHQLEPLRVSANLLILLWQAFSATGRIQEKSGLVEAAAIAGYLGLNLLFLAQNGLHTPGGELRLTLLGLVAATLLLSGLLVRTRRKSLQKAS